MTEKKSQSVRVVYGVYLAIWTVAVALLFIIEVWALFRATDVNPYSVETVSAHFSEIAAPFWIWIAMVLGGGVLAWAFPDVEEKPKAFISVKKTLTRLKGRLPENAEGMVEVNRENVMRKIVWGVSIALCVVSSVVAWKYLMNEEYVVTFMTEFYESHAEAEKLIKIIPWTFAALCVCTGALIYQSYSLKKELALVKQMVADSAKRGEKPAIADKKASVWHKVTEKLAVLGSDKVKNITRLVLCVGGIALVAFGIYNGGMRDVLEKAINICTQCIGLG